MSSPGARRRCIIQKLDFENGIITNIKTTARGRKKLRARITREIEEVPVDTEEQQPSSSQTNQGSASPVLIKRQCRGRESPVFMKRKKISFPEENVGTLSGESTTEEVNSSPGSPVFKMYKKTKTSNPEQVIQKVFGRMSSLDLFSSQENSGSTIQIDEFTQESKPDLKISSFESFEMKNDSVNVCSVDSDAVCLNTSCRGSPGERLSSTVSARETPKPVRRNYKKNSLLGRLQKLQKKRASEKLLWQHQNRKGSSSLTFSVVSFWQEEFYYIFKCRSLTLPDSETNFFIVDSRWVPNVKSIAEGSVLLVHPPWQKLQVDEPSMTVLLNVICLDVLEETEKPVLQKKTVESVSKDQFETDQKLFIDSLFSADSSELFW